MVNDSAASVVAVVAVAAFVLLLLLFPGRDPTAGSSRGGQKREHPEQIVNHRCCFVLESTSILLSTHGKQLLVTAFATEPYAAVPFVAIVTANQKQIGRERTVLMME
jgi:hypothetical protein